MSLCQRASLSCRRSHLYIRNTCMKNFIVVTHPQEEMEEIAEFLDKKCAVVDSLLKDKEAQLEQMKAQRESLIFEYVTGKKRVKEAATNGD